MRLMRHAIYPGSFDPPTNGHLDIIRRSARIFDKLYVAVLENRSKKHNFSAEERVDLLRRITTDLPKVEIITFSDVLLADYMKQTGIEVIIKGLRAVSDFEYEFQMALTNRKLNPDAETIFMPTNIENLYLSSSIVREVAAYGGNLDGLVPEHIKQDIIAKFRRKDDGNHETH